jgi:hypothetical protein
MFFCSRVKLKHEHWCDGRQQAWYLNFSICSCILSVLSSQYLCRRSGLHLRLKTWMRRGFTGLHLLLKTWSYHFISYELMSYHLVCPVLCKILWCLSTCCDFIYFGYIGYTQTWTRTYGYPNLQVVFFWGYYRVIILITRIFKTRTTRPELPKWGVCGTCTWSWPQEAEGPFGAESLPDYQTKKTT